MSDGWDEASAYGYAWWHRQAGGPPKLRLSARNSGLFYIRATRDSRRALAGLKARMESGTGGWDQTAYNEAMWYVAMGGAPAHGLTVRVMPYLCFMNTKTYFRYLRDKPSLLEQLRPVSVHVNCKSRPRPKLQSGIVNSPRPLVSAPAFCFDVSVSVNCQSRARAKRQLWSPDRT